MLGNTENKIFVGDTGYPQNLNKLVKNILSNQNLAPLVRALEIATEKSSFDPSVQQSSNSAPAPAPGILLI